MGSRTRESKKEEYDIRGALKDRKIGSIYETGGFANTFLAQVGPTNLLRVEEKNDGQVAAVFTKELGFGSVAMQWAILHVGDLDAETLDRLKKLMRTEVDPSRN